ncbi:glycine C-acetyltransferase [Syntrophus gentianae]|uniref:Glycine C-acetyltransferase n=1 Tax=Syntrophus gentianae TaxID=43775 RepID=A0A1H7WXH0_9BACT|nr:aminotransferase class I/II-fold pyridoxal phosphate-dependent enzyme [Syntrophus gentianae]SEM25588.1 glycine C-acetyltransferase [Syntrophus gentianae]
MALDKLNPLLAEKLEQLARTGINKRNEGVITGRQPPRDGYGPRYFLHGYEGRPFLRMNANAYLGLQFHPRVIEAEEKAARRYGAGPGAVRFISGTFEPHIELEKRLAAFHGREAAMIFSAAYATVMGVVPQLITPETLVVSDALNHNSIINALRLAQPAAREIYNHLNTEGLEKILERYQGKVKRVLVVTDGVFSMRGDIAPLDSITRISKRFQDLFDEGVIVVVDDSHGVGALGAGGRGTEEKTAARADILIATLGKALGVNGGYVVADRTVIDYLRETAPFYIYSNPMTPSETAAALEALKILDSREGCSLLRKIRDLADLLRQGLSEQGYEILSGEHPIVPLLVRDTAKTKKLVSQLFARNILVTGLSYPVVPRGEEEIRFQITAEHTERDLIYLLENI